MPVFDAASSSSRSTKRPASMSMHAAQMPQGVGVTPVTQLRLFARMRAIVVLPTPRVPVSRYAWCSRPRVERVGERRDDVLLPDELGERLRPPLAGEDLVAHFTRSARTQRANCCQLPGHVKQVLRFARDGEQIGVASRSPGTCRESLWLLPSGPDQVHDAAMRGDPPMGERAKGAIIAARRRSRIGSL